MGARARHQTGRWRAAALGRLGLKTAMAVRAWPGLLLLLLQLLLLALLMQGLPLLGAAAMLAPTKPAEPRATKPRRQGSSHQARCRPPKLTRPPNCPCAPRHGA